LEKVVVVEETVAISAYVPVEVRLSILKPESLADLSVQAITALVYEVGRPLRPVGALCKVFAETAGEKAEEPAVLYAAIRYVCQTPGCREVFSKVTRFAPTFTRNSN